MAKESSPELDKFNRVLKRMLEAPPLSKAEISARIQAEREAKKARAFEKHKEIRKKKLGQ